MNFKVYKNVLAVPCEIDWDISHFLFDENEELIPISSFFSPTRNWLHLSVVPTFLKPSVRGIVPTKTVESAIFGGSYLSSFGNYITDAIVRFWFLRNRIENVHFFPITRQCLEFEGPVVSQFEEITGIDHSNFKFILEPTLFKELIIPEPAWNDHMIPCELWFDFIKECKWEKTLNEHPEKVYIQRGTGVFGESDFIEYLKGEGWYIADRHKLSIKEQRELVQNCKHILTLDGSAVYWSMLIENTGQEMIVIARRPEWCKDIEAEFFTEPASHFMEVSLLEHVIGWIGTDGQWNTKYSFIDWEMISQDMKIMGLVNSEFKEKGQSRDELMRFVLVNGDTASLKEQAKEILDIYAYRNI